MPLYAFRSKSCHGTSWMGFIIDNYTEQIKGFECHCCRSLNEPSCSDFHSDVTSVFAFWFRNPCNIRSTVMRLYTHPHMHAHTNMHVEEGYSMRSCTRFLLMLKRTFLHL